MFLRFNGQKELVNPNSVDKATFSERDGKPHLTVIINGSAHDYSGEDAVDAFAQLHQHHLPTHEQSHGEVVVIRRIKEILTNRYAVLVAADDGHGAATLKELDLEIDAYVQSINVRVGGEGSH